MFTMVIIAQDVFGICWDPGSLQKYIINECGIATGSFSSKQPLDWDVWETKFGRVCDIKRISKYGNGDLKECLLAGDKGTSNSKVIHKIVSLDVKPVQFLVG